MCKGGGLTSTHCGLRAPVLVREKGWRKFALQEEKLQQVSIGNYWRLRLGIPASPSGVVVVEEGSSFAHLKT